MTTTPNLGLTKDAETGELYSVKRVNDNSDRIDDFAGQVLSELPTKQPLLTFDSEPIEDSENPVTSGGIYTALHELTEKIQNLTERIEALEGGG